MHLLSNRKGLFIIVPSPPPLTLIEGWVKEVIVMGCIPNGGFQVLSWDCDWWVGDSLDGWEREEANIEVIRDHLIRAFFGKDSP